MASVIRPMDPTISIQKGIVNKERIKSLGLKETALYESIFQKSDLFRSYLGLTVDSWICFVTDSGPCYEAGIDETMHNAMLVLERITRDLLEAFDNWQATGRPDFSAVDLGHAYSVLESMKDVMAALPKTKQWWGLLTRVSSLLAVFQGLKASVDEALDLDAKGALVSSLPILQKKDKSIYGCSPKDSDVLQAKAKAKANAKPKPIYKKLEVLSSDLSFGFLVLKGIKDYLEAKVAAIKKWGTISWCRLTSVDLDMVFELFEGIKDEIEAKVAAFQMAELSRMDPKRRFWILQVIKHNLKAEVAVFEKLKESLKEALDSKAKTDLFLSLPIHKKNKKSIHGCSPKDSGELKAGSDELSAVTISLNISEENSRFRFLMYDDLSFGNLVLDGIKEYLEAKVAAFKKPGTLSWRRLSSVDLDLAFQVFYSIKDEIEAETAMFVKAKLSRIDPERDFHFLEFKAIVAAFEKFKESLDSEAIAALSSSLPNREKEEISIWGCSLPKDMYELKAKAAVFPKLPTQEKVVCLMAASFAIQDYDEQVRRFRKEEKDLLYYEGWTACLYKEELEMIGELDGKEAEKIYDESQKNPYDHYCFEIHLDRNRFDYMIQKYGELLPYEDVPNESFYKGPFADRKIDKSNEQEAGSYILGDKVRKKMLAEYESYQMKMEEVMCKWIGQYFSKELVQNKVQAI